LGPKARRVLRAFLLALSVALIYMGLGDYGLLRLLVRFLCPSCVGLA